ncbi:MAG TPA: hypothetical protein VG245_08510, partial [Candidatus Dormibacteraeota bacterium]|nr:hypothetical protein [Candidatus Dormibacteraeota bacterium]
MGAIALGGGAAWLWLPARDRPTPEVLADGVRLTSGVQGVSPGIKLALGLSPGEAIGDLSAFVDGRPAALRALGPGRAAVGATPLSQGAWHAIVVRRRGGLLRAEAVVRVSFRTADPIQVFAGWTAGGGRVNVDVGASRPLADGAPVAAALARAGATVENAEGRVLGHWTARAGAAYAFTVPAGLRAQTGSYLAAPFHAAYTAPASGDGMLMQVSGEPPTASTGLRLQVYFVS